MITYCSAEEFEIAKKFFKRLGTPHYCDENKFIVYIITGDKDKNINNKLLGAGNAPYSIKGRKSRNFFSIGGGK